MAVHRRLAVQSTASFASAADEPAPDCRQVLANFWDYADGNCAPGLAERIDAHVSTCELCLRFRQTQERFLASLAELREQSPAPPRVHDRVRRALEAERRRKPR